MRKYSMIAALACNLMSLSVAAQEPDRKRPVAPAGWTVNVGAGALFSPNYLGDDAYSLSVVPYVRVSHGDQFFASIQEGAGYRVINEENFRAGPLASISFGRDEDGSSAFRIAGNRTDDLRGLGDIDTSFSIGGFAEIDFGDFTASAKLSQALNGHDGFTGDVGVSYKRVVRGNGPPIIYAFGPRLNFGDDQYLSALFSVDPVQSQASGLSSFEASGGMVSYGVSGSAIMPLSDAVSLSVIGNYHRLTADAGNSSLVRERGSRDQAFVGVIASYKIR